jgi:quercetin dioxygenase-like cupin family protein
MPRHFKSRPSVLDRATVRRIATSLSAGELPRAQRNSMRERISARIAGIQSPGSNDSPARSAGLRGDGIGWQIFWPNVWVKVLRQDLHNNKQTALFRVLPGGVVPACAHPRDEECLVLEGEVFIGEHRVSQGDLHVAGPDACHRDITTRTGAMLMLRSETPLQRKGTQRLTG